MNETIFIKHKKEKNFTVLDNACIKDTRLSWKAKGLHTYLESLPTDWKIHMSDIVDHASDGKDSLNSAVKELIKFGYLKKIPQRKQSGRFGGILYVVYENPEDVEDQKEAIDE